MRPSPSAPSPPANPIHPAILAGLINVTVSRSSDTQCEPPVRLATSLSRGKMAPFTSVALWQVARSCDSFQSRRSRRTNLVLRAGARRPDNRPRCARNPFCMRCSDWLRRMEQQLSADLNAAVSYDNVGEVVHDRRGESDVTWEEPGFGDQPRPKVDSVHYNKRHIPRPTDTIGLGQLG